MRLGPKAPADKVVQAARVVADNDLAAEAAAHSAAEVADVFFASK